MTKFHIYYLYFPLSWHLLTTYASHSIFYHCKSPLSVNSWFSFYPSLEANVFVLKMNKKKVCETFSILKRVKLKKALEASERYHKGSFKRKSVISIIKLEDLGLICHSFKNWGLCVFMRSRKGKFRKVPKPYFNVSLCVKWTILNVDYESLKNGYISVIMGIYKIMNIEINMEC